ncbi:MAG: hypothetical protein WCC36_15950 [Gammaproteobacteria bacterium]
MEQKFSAMQILAVTLLTLSFAAPASATLLGIQPGLPKIAFGSLSGQGATFDAGTGAISFTGVPYYYQPTASTLVLKPFAGSTSLQIGFDVNSSGAITGHRGGGDFVLTGTVDTGVPGGTYTGTLLTGNIDRFGFLNQSATTDAMDFVFNVTGGSMMSLYGSGSLGVAMSLENSTFDGSFTGSFSSTRIKGAIGAVAPPQSIPDPSTPLLLLAGLPLMMRAVRRRGNSSTA